MGARIDGDPGTVSCSAVSGAATGGSGVSGFLPTVGVSPSWPSWSLSSPDCRMIASETSTSKSVSSSFKAWKGLVSKMLDKCCCVFEGMGYGKHCNQPMTCETSNTISYFRFCLNNQEGSLYEMGPACLHC